MRIAYLSHLYPHLTETFVYREVLALRRQGVDVRTFGARRPDKRDLSLESHALVDETEYVLPLDVVAFLRNHARALARRPVAYPRTAAMLVTRRGEPARTRALSALHFLMGVHLARAIERSGATHVHAQFSINAATIGLVAARMLGLPFSFTAHNLLFTKPMALSEKIAEAAFVVAISEHTRRFVIERARPLDVAGKVHVIHCGVDTGVAPVGAAAPESSPPRVLFVGQLAPRKGALVLAQACALLKARGVAFRCEVVGGGAERELVEEARRRAGLSEALTLRGALPQERVVERFEHADVFVLPCVTAPDGDVDGIPVALMEAMVRGVPVISTGVSGIPELVEHEVTGLVVPERDAAALADALERLFADGGLRARLGAAGRERVRESFDVDRSAAQLAALFARYAGAAPTGGRATRTR